MTAVSGIVRLIAFLIVADAVAERHSHWTLERHDHGDAAAEQLQLSLLRRQHFRSCNATGRLTYFMTQSELGGAGLGATLHSATLALAHASLQDWDRHFAVSEKDAWMFGAYIGLSTAELVQARDAGILPTWKRFFQPAGRCRAITDDDNDSHGDRTQFRLVVYEPLEVSPANYQEEELAWHRLAQGTGLPSLPLQGSPSAVAIPAERRGDWFWLSAQLLYFLVQPRRELIDTARLLMRRTGLDDGGECVALHVRGSDKSTEAATWPLAAYMDALGEMRAAYGVRRVLLITEDAAVVAGLQSMMADASNRHGAANFTFTATAEDLGWRRKPSVWTTGEVLTSPALAFDEARQALINLIMALECSYFVGTFSSNWSRVILRMMYATRGHLPPYISLAHWCCDVLSNTHQPPPRWTEEAAATGESTELYLARHTVDGQQSRGLGRVHLPGRR